MTCCTAFVHECSPLRPSSALCGPPAGRWGSSLGISPLEAVAGPPRPGDPGARAPAATCRCPRSSGRDALSYPTDLVDLAEAILPAPGAGVRRRLRRPADRRVGRAPPKPRRSTGRGGHRGRDPHRVQGQADRRPARRPKEVTVRAGHTSVSFTLAAAATRRSLAGRGGPVPSGKGLDYGVRQHGRKPQDGRSPG
jgi:hypothetical protein